jgi:hypothetical protein
MKSISASNPLRREALRVAAILAAAILGVSATARSGSGSGTGSGSQSTAGSSTPASAVAYSHCMRSHGVANYPGPDSSGNLPKADAQHLGVSSSQLQAAQQACQRLLPNNGGALSAASLQQCELGGDCLQGMVQQALTQLRNFAQCMRSHGVASWPDPTTDSQGRPGFAISVSKDGFDPHTAEIRTKADECEHVMHPDIGVPLGVSR